MFETVIYDVIIYIERLNIKQLYITDRSKAILLFWFYLFCVLESNFVLFEPYVRFHV